MTREIPRLLTIIICFEEVEGTTSTRPLTTGPLTTSAHSLRPRP